MTCQLYSTIVHYRNHEVVAQELLRYKMTFTMPCHLSIKKKPTH